jgi:hypothetical protein
MGMFGQMDIHFLDEQQIPLPPEKVRFRDVEATLLPDKRRVRLSMWLTPFQAPPNIDISAFDSQQRPVGSATIIEAIEPRMAITLHLRGSIDPGLYTIALTLHYEQNGPVDGREVQIEIPEGPEDKST